MPYLYDGCQTARARAARRSPRHLSVGVVDDDGGRHGGARHGARGDVVVVPGAPEVGLPGDHGEGGHSVIKEDTRPPPHNPGPEPAAAKQRVIKDRASRSLKL